MGHRIKDIAAALGAVAHGNLDLEIERAAEPADAGFCDLALAMNPRFAEDLKTGQARAAVLWPGADWQALGLEAAIEAPRARLALSHLTTQLAEPRCFTPGIHAMTAIAEDAEIDADAWIGAFSEIGAKARIGSGARIAGRVTIGAGCVIGDGVALHAGVVLQPGTRLGDRVTIHPGTVIGADGFSYVTEETSHPERLKAEGGAITLTPYVPADWHKIHSLGGVVVEDDVEIGANCAIDAGTIRPTKIGARTKLDNLVHVGHNCTIGVDTLICGQVGLAGSVSVGDRVVLAGQVGVGDHHFIGNDVIAAGASKIMANVPAGRVVLGYPAQRMDKTLDGVKTLRRLARKPVPKTD